MPLRDHFRPPAVRWPSVYPMWPMVIVQQLFHRLPDGYRSAPRVYGERPDVSGPVVVSMAEPRPRFTSAVELPEMERYEVRGYASGRRLVSVVKLVGPTSKGRPRDRRRFVAECAGLLADGVNVSVVDVVTDKFFNLYAELLAEVGGADPALGSDPTPTYAVGLRARDGKRRRPLDTWYHPLAVGGRLPELPLWLADDQHVMLDLEASYEETCKYLHIA